MSLSMSDPGIDLETFLQSAGLARFVGLHQGQLVCLEPNNPEAQEMYAAALAAIEHGTISDLRHSEDAQPSA